MGKNEQAAEEAKEKLMKQMKVATGERKEKLEKEAKDQEEAAKEMAEKAREREESTKELAAKALEQEQKAKEFNEKEKAAKEVTAKAESAREKKQKQEKEQADKELAVKAKKASEVKGKLEVKIKAEEAKEIKEKREAATVHLDEPDLLTPMRKDHKRTAAANEFKGAKASEFQEDIDYKMTQLQNLTDTLVTTSDQVMSPASNNDTHIETAISFKLMQKKHVQYMIVHIITGAT